MEGILPWPELFCHRTRRSLPLVESLAWDPRKHVKVSRRWVPASWLWPACAAASPSGRRCNLKVGPHQSRTLMQASTRLWWSRASAWHRTRYRQAVLLSQGNLGIWACPPYDAGGCPTIEISSAILSSVWHKGLDFCLLGLFWATMQWELPCGGPVYLGAAHPCMPTNSTKPKLGKAPRSLFAQCAGRLIDGVSAPGSRNRSRPRPSRGVLPEGSLVEELGLCFANSGQAEEEYLHTPAA